MHVKTRKLQPRLAARAAVVLALAGAGLAATATPSYAADSATLSRSHGPSGGGYNVILTEINASDLSGGVGPYEVQFNIAGTCPGTAATPAPVTQSAGTVNAGIVSVPNLTMPVGATLTVPVP
jgi:hypothetical protein